MRKKHKKRPAVEGEEDEAIIDRRRQLDTKDIPVTNSRDNKSAAVWPLFFFL